MTTRRNELSVWARRLGLGLETHRPGDGTRKYDFFVLNPADPHKFTRVAGYAIGSKQAEVFLRGYESGIQTAIDNLKEESSVGKD